MYCRDRSGLQPFQIYKLITCTMCYYYLFPKLNVFHQTSDYRLTIISNNFTVIPDVENITMMSELCNAIKDGRSCNRWTSCCSAAVKCCQQQQRNTEVFKPPDNNTLYCPATWDGYACWNTTPAKKRAFKTCPDYVTDGIWAYSREDAYKDCTANGTWWRHPKTHQEWSNYSTCIDAGKHQVIVLVDTTFCLLSIILLLPACTIFLYFRTLRIQHRIRLHLNLFVSLILTSILYLLWNHLFNPDHILHHPGETHMDRNTVGCRILNFVLNYIQSTNYFCMLIEGYYLYRLLAATFERPKTLVPYYIFSWGFPLIPSLIYAAVRGIMFNERCWVFNSEPYDWIMFVPNLLCIAGNLFFLVYILAVLVGRLQSHANEPSNYRRTVKATLVLIPLFGLQQILIMYKPPKETYYAYPYQIISSVVTHSQGGLVSLVFCFFNREVHSNIRSALERIKNTPMRPFDRNSYTTTTQLQTSNARSFIHLNSQFSMAAPRTGQSAKYDNPANYTPLTVINKRQV
ncbi:calcitonin gene-related peptide type 1 receptor-like [Argonauta hians]